MKLKFLFTLCILLISGHIFGQDSLSVTVDDASKSLLDNQVEYDPLAPSKAAFYSAVLPGLGQAYNKKYWKIPIVYVGIGAGIYFYLEQDKEYDRFRNAYKRRLAGFTDDEFYGDPSNPDPLVSNARLIDAQQQAQKNKDISIIVSIAFYLINIIDANVDAHLRQFNVNDDLSLIPNLNIDPVTAQTQYGLSFRFNFGNK